MEREAIVSARVETGGKYGTQESANGRRQTSPEEAKLAVFLCTAKKTRGWHSPGVWQGF